MSNVVYIATSLDGYIADKDGGLDWLHSVPNPDNDDLGWSEFLADIDAIVMGRNTFETVCGFDVPWPYPVPVFVLSSQLAEIPAAFTDKAELLYGSPAEVVAQLQQRGHQRLYIDGGNTIQRFLQADLIDELIVTQLPVLLGDGAPLFGSLASAQQYQLVGSQVLLNNLVKNHFKRVR
ncbi:dihydrofolate reductase family protein [Ferrimonas senticii]|uniref:dihydrofolate reductase family protein n=1 Tax=Ferrimonas senticii TaxID=394566 RepID=UPI00041DB5E6|nr:dihydrofolate reductase family protein [Ferrimonas senticii]